MAHRISKLGGQHGGAAESPNAVTLAIYIGSGDGHPDHANGVSLDVPVTVSDVFNCNPELLKALLQGYGNAISASREAGQPISFRVDVDPAGGTRVTPVETRSASTKTAEAADTSLGSALARARARGRLRAAEILNGDDMLGTEQFAELLGTTRVTVNKKRQIGHVLGIEGAKRGFRFPVWQIDREGKPYRELAELHARLGGAWPVYRFLVQPHDELSGLTGRQALEQGASDAALEVAESVGRDFS